MSSNQYGAAALGPVGGRDLVALSVLRVRGDSPGDRSPGGTSLPRLHSPE